MTLVLALACAGLFGAGTFLLLRRDLVQDVAGMILISNSVNLFIMAAGLSRGRAPIHPVADAGAVSDPLVQAMALTAVVIGFGVAALLLGLVFGVYVAHGTIDQEELRAAESRDAEALDVDAREQEAA